MGIIAILLIAFFGFNHVYSAFDLSFYSKKRAYGNHSQDYSNKVNFIQVNGECNVPATNLINNMTDWCLLILLFFEFKQ